MATARLLQSSWRLFHGNFFRRTYKEDPANSVTLVQNEVPEVISRKFKGKQVTVSMLKSKGNPAGMFRDYFDRLNALYVMVALGRARKLKKKLGKTMLFRVK